MIKNTNQRGYSLLELIVSLGLFSVVMLVVLAAYITLISLDRQARASNQLAASLSFATESMARSIRTGTRYSCNGVADQNCNAPGGASFSFLNSQGEVIGYRVKSDGSIGQCSLSYLGQTCLDANAIALTDPRISITSLRFIVRGVGSSDVYQPYVTISIAGTMTTDAGETADFSIQTGATQRFIDI